MSRRNVKRWREYERLKAKLKAQNLPPNEYERRLREIAKRLRI